MRTWFQQNGHRGPRSHQEEPVTHAFTENKRFAKKCRNKKEKCCNLLRLWFWVLIIAVPFYLALSRIGEADNPGLAYAAAKLFGDKFDAIGQWAANLTSKSAVELAPLFTQVGECRQMFSKRFEK